MPGSPAWSLAEAASAAWPELRDDAGLFRVFLEERGADDLTPERAGDLFLAWACGRGAPAAVAAFDRRYGRDLRAIAARAGLAAHAVEEAVQAIRVRLLVGSDGEPPRITQFQGRSDLLSWLRISVLRLAILLVRRARQAGSSEELELLAAPVIDAEARLFRERYQDAFRDAFIEALADLERDDRVLLRHRYLDAMTEAQLAQLLGLHRVTVARRVAAARRRLLAGTRARLRARLDLPTADLDSIMRAAHGDLAITLRRVMLSDPGVGG